MTLLELVEKANNGYEDGFLEEYFDKETGEYKEGRGDTLAAFVVIELNETFDAEADADSQISTAIQAMDMAKRDIEGIMAALAA